MGKWEKIKVFIRYENGHTACICPRDDKRCNKPCEKETVFRDKYESWEKTFRQDKYGK